MTDPNNLAAVTSSTLLLWSACIVPNRESTRERMTFPMAGRILALSFVLVLLALVVGCGQSAQLTGVSITPTTVEFETNVPSPNFEPTTATAQLTATGTYSNGKNGTVYTRDITDQVVWESSITDVATVSATGVVSPTGCGVTTINAKAGNGGLVATVSVSVCTQTGGFLGSLTSLKVMAPPQTLNNRGDRAQYIAIGTYAGSNETRDLTDQVKWSTSDSRVAMVNALGLVTAVAPCSNIGSGPEATITAFAPGSSGSSLTGTATFAMGSCGASNAATLTVHQAGEGSGKVISNPARISCSGGEGCTGNFSLNAPVTLTASPNSGSVFGGFSATCTPVIPDPSGCPASLRGANVKSCTCATRVTNSGAVGAIFNPAQ